DMLLPTRFRNAHRHSMSAFATSADAARRMGERQDIFGRRKDGSEFPAEASISKLEFAGEMIFTVILRDITIRKQVEQTLRAQNEALERANMAKDRFLASMSHELRTPLNAVIGFTGTLLMRLPGPLNAEQERQLRTIQTSAKHLLSLINDLLDLAKIESGKVELRLERVDCHAVIAEVVTSLRPLADQKGLSLRILGGDTPVFTHSDRRALSQIMFNLVNNAIKFTDRGEVCVEIACFSKSEQAQIAIHVSDSGIGIRAEDRAMLFQAFKQAETGNAARPEGAGLGLHLSQKLAQLLGGHITCRSTYGEGSRFTLTIPGV
ncbi:MAG TPA: ATP-binding protein, partial [Roseiflexaceae bacterium]|nr:ATP-binding protein [Roseiflexaceae bacterium]